MSFHVKMDHHTGVLLVLSYIFHCTCLVQSAGLTGISNDLVVNNDNVYGLSFERLNKDGKCQELVHVSGKGIKDTFKVSCKNRGVKGIKSTDFLIYQNPGDSLSLYSDTDSELVVVEDDKCSLKTYTTVGRWTTSTSTPLSGKDCDKAKQRVMNGDVNFATYSAHQTLYLYGTVWRLFPGCFPFCISTAIIDLLKTWQARYDTVTQVNKDGQRKSEEEEAKRKKAEEEEAKRKKAEEEEAKRKKAEEEEAKSKKAEEEEEAEVADWNF